jgi:hypothetical protein
MVVFNAISDALKYQESLLIGRNGTIELECILNPYDTSKTAILENNAGIFPLTVASFYYKWIDKTIEAIKNTSIIAAGWYEPLKEEEAVALYKWNPDVIQTPLRSLEPYYSPQGEQWTSLLAGHKVSVVTCFTKTAQSQVEKGLSNIWGSNLHIPNDISWSWVQTGHPRSVAKGRNEWPPYVHSWLQAVDYVVFEVVKQEARIAIIGCGGLSMPIASMLKDRGIITIVMGGAIQVLFGIKGKRWESHDVISKFWNEHWVWPLEQETPRGANLIEGGCYWG